MAANALQTEPPLGTFRDFVTIDVPGSPHSIDMKLYGVRPFVDAARIYSLALGLPHTNTVQRLRSMGEGARMSEPEVEATVDAFLAIQRLRLRNQASKDTLDGETANRIDPDKLNQLDRKILKEAFRLAHRLQRRLALVYQL
jgi:CBS domain-containing protein